MSTLQDSVNALKSSYDQSISDTGVFDTMVVHGDDNKRNYNATVQTNRANYLQNQMTNDYNLLMYEDEKEYNSAVNQRARLEEAGLNPYLMLDGGDAGSVTSVPQAQQTPFQAPQYDVAAASQWLSSVVNSVGSVVDSARGLTETAKSSIDLQTYGARNIASLENLKASTRDSNLKADYQQIQNYIADQTKQNQVSIVQSQDEHAQLVNTYQKYSNTIRQLEAENMPEQLRIAIAKGNAEVKLTEREVSLAEEKINNAKKEGVVLDRQAELVSAQVGCTKAQAKAALASAAASFESVKNLAEQRTGIKLNNDLQRKLLSINVQTATANLEKDKNDAVNSGSNLGVIGNNMSNSDNIFIKGVGYVLYDINAITNSLGNVFGIGR